MNRIKDQELDIKDCHHSRPPPSVFNSLESLSKPENLIYKTAAQPKLQQ